MRTSLFLSMLALCVLAACRPGIHGASEYAIDLDKAVSASEAGDLILVHDEVVMDPNLSLSDDVELLVSDGIILLRDRQGRIPSLCLLDRDGLMHDMISRQGDGPEEYLGLDHFQYADKTVEIQDGPGNRLLHYSLECEFLDAVQAGFPMGGSAYIRDGSSCWFDRSYSPADEGAERFCLVRTDGELEVQEAFLPHEGALDPSLAPRHAFWTCDGRVHYFQPFTRTAYELVPGKEPETAWTLDFGADDSVSTLNAEETSDQICLDLSSQGRNYLVAISKKTGKTCTLRFDGAIPSGFLPITTWEGWFVAMDPGIPLIRFFKFDL